jgi:hypothetical protein
MNEIAASSTKKEINKTEQDTTYFYFFSLTDLKTQYRQDKLLNCIAQKWKFIHANFAHAINLLSTRQDTIQPVFCLLFLCKLNKIK